MCTGKKKKEEVEELHERSVWMTVWRRALISNYSPAQVLELRTWTGSPVRESWQDHVWIS